MSGKVTIRLFRIFLILFLATMGLVGKANGLDVGFRGQNMVMFSDNIDRAPDGIEISGSRLIMQGDLDLSGDLGLGTIDIGAGGGWESLENEGIDNADNFNFRLAVRLPWSEKGSIVGSASTSDATEEPDISDISQARVRTRRSEAGLELDKQATPTFHWSTAIIGRSEKRFDRDLKEASGEFGYDLILDRRRSLGVDARFERGKDDFDEDLWTGASVSIDFGKRFDRVTSGGYRLAWEGRDIEHADGTVERSDKVNAVAYYGKETATGWSVSSSLGVDGVKPSTMERSWEANARLSLSNAPERKIRTTASISSSSTIQDPNEDDVAWTRDRQFRTGIAWKVTRTFTVEPSAQYRLADLIGGNVPDRTDTTLIVRLGMRWIPARNWSVALNAHKEERDSSQNFYDLSENRLELSFSGSFL